MTRLLLLASILAFVTHTQADDLVVNGGFERSTPNSSLPEFWRADGNVYSLDKTMNRSGDASLRYENSDPNRYRLAAQKVPLQPGRKYRFSAWVKTETIAGQESGATICLEWQGKDGQWMGGSYPSGVKGTTDWTEVEGIVRIPKEAASVNFSCYVRKGMTGTAWFDDARIERIIDPPMRSVLISPNYRGRITNEGPEHATVRVHLDLTDYDMPLKDLRLGWLLTSADGSRLDGRSGLKPNTSGGGATDLEMPLPKLSAGRYDLAIQLLGPDEKVLQESKQVLHRVADDFRPTCWIDPHGRLLVEGKPFLPLGMYWSQINEDDLKVYADSKFNCLMPYGSPKGEQMDLAHRYGMKVIYSVKDLYAGSRHTPGFINTESDEKPNVLNRVERFRNHPALLAWYLNDELPQSYMPRLEAHQRWVAEADPNHPTWVVLYQFREVGAYINTFDVIGTDPYPIGRAPASEAAMWTAETRRQVDGARPLWQVPQVHNWINYRKDDGKGEHYHSPTRDEMRSMAWQCLCEGATGLIFYSWYDLKRNPDVPFDQQWGELKEVVAEIDRFSPVILSVEERPAIRLEVSLADQSPSVQPSWLHLMVRHQGGKTYVFAVNDGDGEGKVRFSFQGISRVHDLTNDRALEIERHGFNDALEPLALRVYELSEEAE